jgi:hypothetical protein
MAKATAVSTSRKVPISERALIQRINRKLKEKGARLHKTRGENTQAWIDCGDYYILNVDRNYVMQKNVGIEAIATDLGVLKPYEAVFYPETER